jgi:hypothetical protein
MYNGIVGVGGQINLMIKPCDLEVVSVQRRHYGFSRGTTAHWKGQGPLKVSSFGSSKSCVHAKHITVAETGGAVGAAFSPVHRTLQHRRC